MKEEPSRSLFKSCCLSNVNSFSLERISDVDDGGRMLDDDDDEAGSCVEAFKIGESIN